MQIDLEAALRLAKEELSVRHILCELGRKYYPPGTAGAKHIYDSIETTQALASAVRGLVERVRELEREAEERRFNDDEMRFRSQGES